MSVAEGIRSRSDRNLVALRRIDVNRMHLVHLKGSCRPDDLRIIAVLTPRPLSLDELFPVVRSVREADFLLVHVIRSLVLHLGGLLLDPPLLQLVLVRAELADAEAVL